MNKKYQRRCKKEFQFVPKDNTEEFRLKTKATLESPEANSIHFWLSKNDYKTSSQKEQKGSIQEYWIWNLRIPYFYTVGTKINLHLIKFYLLMVFTAVLKKGSLNYFFKKILRELRKLNCNRIYIEQDWVDLLTKGKNVMKTFLNQFY